MAALFKRNLIRTRELPNRNRLAFLLAKLQYTLRAAYALFFANDTVVFRSKARPQRLCPTLPAVRVGGNYDEYQRHHYDDNYQCWVIHQAALLSSLSAGGLRRLLPSPQFQSK